MSDQKIYQKFYPEGVPKEIGIPDKTLVDVVEESVANYPDNPATYYMGFQLSYTQLKDIIDRTATKLTQLGIKKGDCVAIQFANTPSFIAYYHGILKIGGIVTALSPLFKSLEVKRQLNDSEAKIYIGWEGFSGIVDPIIEETGVEHKFESNLAPYLSPDPMAPPEFEMGGDPTFEDVIREVEPNPPDVSIDPDDIALLQYTGGTTGFPKGAMLTHRNIIANVLQAYAWFIDKSPGEETLLAALPFYHIFMGTMMNFGLYLGAQIALVFNPREAHEIIEVIEATQATLFPGVAAIFNNLNNYEKIKEHDFSSLKYCISGAGPLPKDVWKRFEELTGAKLREGYGLTEMSPFVTANPFQENFKIGSIGIPFPNTDIKICDPEGNTLDIGEIGELVCRGPQMMKGYYKREKETANTIKDGWLWTGDLAEMDEDGYLAIRERVKNMIKYKGHSVYPTEVEDLLYNYEPIKECAVIGIIDDEGKENIKAYISLKDEFEGKVSAQDVIDWSKKNMGFEKYPRFVDFIDEIPKTIVGKVLHRELREKEQQK
ncbi:MAG: AMP-binding protein [Candidatus Lokiarchaeota archaeon]|nr:AMP-binding protein [Candidatus Lokiarchaeota archaeon]